MKGWANLGTGDAVELASAGARLGARLLDVMLIPLAALSLMAMIPLVWTLAFGLWDGEAYEAFWYSDDSEFGAVVAALPWIWIATCIAPWIAFEVAFVALKGQSPGKMATRIRVVRADEGLDPGWGRSISRSILPAALVFIPVVGWLLLLLVCISLLWDRARQGWHDKVARTLVIKTTHSPEPKASSNRHGGAAFVLGVFSLIPVVGMIVGPIGIVHSSGSLNQRRHEGAPRRRLALAGFVLSMVGTGINTLLAGVAVIALVGYAVFNA